MSLYLECGPPPTQHSPHSPFPSDCRFIAASWWPGCKLRLCCTLLPPYLVVPQDAVTDESLVTMCAGIRLDQSLFPLEHLVALDDKE